MNIHKFHCDYFFKNFIMKNLLAILALAGIVYGCPSGISPCKCTDTLPGVTIDCTSAHSSKDIQNVFAVRFPFHFYQ